MPQPLTWAEAAEAAMKDSSQTWHTAVDIFDLVVEKQLKEMNHGRSRAIESLRTALINHYRRGSGKFAWDQQSHMFALYSKIHGGRKKVKKKVPSKVRPTNRHAAVSDVSPSAKGSRRNSGAERREQGSALDAHSPWERPTLLSSPSQEPRIIPFEGVLHHEEHSCHGNTVYYDPLPQACVAVRGESPHMVEVSSSSPGAGRRGLVQSLNLFDLRSRHCVAPPPKHGVLITRKFLQRKKHERASQRAFSFPPIEFKSEHFPEVAFHYISRADHTSCANDTEVFFHIDRGSSKDHQDPPHVVAISPEAVIYASESETETEGGEEEEEVRPVHVPYSKPRMMTKLQSPVKKSLLKSPTLAPRPQLQPHPRKEGTRLQPPPKAREKLQQNKAGTVKGKSPCPRKPQLAITQRDVHHLLTHPDAALSKINLRGLLTFESFTKLPVEQRKTVAQFLPSLDQEGDAAGNVTARKSAFSNVFFAAALREWQKSLKNSEFTPEYQARVRADERKRMVDATQTSIKPPRLVFPPEPCHVPKCHEVSAGEAEEKLLSIVSCVVQELTRKEEEATNQDCFKDDLLGGPNLECTEKLNGGPVRVTAAGKGGRMSRLESNRMSNLPQRGRPKHAGVSSSLPTRGRPKNTSLPIPNCNGLVVPVKRPLQHSTAGASLTKRHQPMNPRTIHHPYLVPGSGLAEAVQRSPTLANRLPELLTPNGLRLDYLSFVPSHIPYKEIIATLQKANDPPTPPKHGRGSEAQRRRSQSQPPKRYLARHVVNQANPVYHDHFAVLDLDHQPEQFEVGNGGTARAVSSNVQSRELPELDSHSHSSNAGGKREDLLFSVTESIPQRPCSCDSLPMAMCQNCKYLYHSSCTSVCAGCGWSLTVSY